MKRLFIAISIFFISISGYTQSSIQAIEYGMSGRQFKDAINTNIALLYNKEKTINVKEYGAVGDGTTNDAIAVLNAINAATDSNKVLIFPDGDYYLHGQMNISLTNKSIEIVGQGNANIIGFHDETQIVGGWVFTSANGNPCDIDVDVNEGSEFIISNQIASTVDVNDLIHIKSTELYCNNVYKGEIATVLKKENDTIYLVIPTRQMYHKNSTDVLKINYGKAKISNLKFTHYRLDFTSVNNLIIDNNEFYNSNTQPISISLCKNVMVSNNYLLQDTITSSTGYGIGIAATENFKVLNNEVYNYPQNIACGGFYSCRNGIYGYNKVANRFTAAKQAILDTHQGTESVKIIGNEVWGSIYAKGNDIDILYNHVFIAQTGRIGIERLIEQSEYSIQVPPDVRYEQIIGNIVRDLEPGYTSTYGIRINQHSARDTVDYVNIQGNYVKTGGYALQFADEGHVDTYFSNINVSDNYFEALDDQSSISIPAITIGEITFNNNVIKGHGSYSLTVGGALVCENMNILNNKFYTDYWSNLHISGMDKLIVSGNIFNGGSLITTSVNNIIIDNNTFQNDNSNNPIYIDGTSGYVLVKDNNYFNNKKTFTVNALSLSALNRNETYFLTGALTDDTPTNAEVNAICGLTAETYGKGVTLIIKDSNGTALSYKFISDGTSWIYEKPYKAN